MQGREHQHDRRRLPRCARALARPASSLAGGLALALALSLLAGAPAAQRARRPVVGLDARGGFDAAGRLADGADYDTLRERLAARGVELRAVHAFTPLDLVGLDLLVLHQPYEDAQRISARERTAIRSLVRRGAGLLVHGDVGGRSEGQVQSLNQLLAPYGVRFAPASTGPELAPRTVTRFVPHPLTADLGAIAVDAPRPLAEIRAPALDLTGGGTAHDVLAVVERPDSGAVVVLGDASLWRDADTGADVHVGVADNARLLENVIDLLLPRRDLPAFETQTLEEPGLGLRLDGLRDRWLGLPASAEALLRLVLPEATGSGCFVELTAAGAEPGALLLVLLGAPNETDTLTDAQLLTTVTADGSGRATFAVPIPTSAAGHAFGLRVLDPAAGALSPVMRIEPQRDAEGPTPVVEDFAGDR